MDCEAPDHLAERVFRGTAENQLPDARWPKIMADMDH
jgi:hypothetical protein